MNPNPPGGTGWGRGGARRGGKTFSWRLGGRLGVAGSSASSGPRGATQRPAPTSWLAVPRARHLAPGGPGARARSRGSEAARGEDADAAERGRCPPPPHAQLALRVSGSPQRHPGALRAAGCRRPRRLEGAALSVARGRLNPFLGLPGLEREVRSDGREHRRTHRARRRLGTPGHPLAAARPAPHPQQFTCWSPQLAARQGRAAGTLWRWPQPPSFRLMALLK
ncbi:serine/arginine repetitive matrix protein 3-like [Microtus oregoni]|uniref:serine/arginine repetitive matrix protein 3-like n=1 Tax=Microtus oregoni TaxID=111838 RepID=UPI001BB13623|nr:serine/arginine repetitive matrix protein 3-like [Microtus oregoni]